METVNSENYQFEGFTLSNGKIYPSGTLEESMWPTLIQSENPFLNAIAKKGKFLYLMLNEWTVMTKYSSALFFIYKDHVLLECVATKSEDRGKGHGMRLMKMLIDAADEAGVTLKLKTSTVNKHNLLLPNHYTIACGADKKGKIPLEDLPTWYEKFGFVKLTRASAKGYHMEREPNQR